MKLVIQTGNTGTPTLLNTNKIGTEPFLELANYQHKESNENGGTYYADSSREIQGELGNLSGSIVTVDRTIVFAKKSTVTMESPFESFEAEVFIDNIGGEKDMGRKNINSIYIKNNDNGKLEKTNSEFIIKPKISIYDLVDFTNDVASQGFVNQEGIEKLKNISTVNTVVGVELFDILKEHLSENAKNDKNFIKSAAKLGLDFDDVDAKMFISDLRGIRYSDIELIEAKNNGYYNPEHYAKTENIILDDMQSFMEEEGITITVKTVNTNFIDFGHDEAGNIIVNKNAKLPEVKNGFMFKELGLDKLVKPISIATSNINNLLSPDRSEETVKKIMNGVESLEMLVNELNDTKVSDAFKKIDITKVVNSKNIKDVSKEYNALLDVAFSVKSEKLKEFASQHNMIDVNLTKGGEGRIVGKKFGYERPTGLSLDGEKIVQRMASLHEIRPLTIDGGVQGGMQVKSQKVSALEYIFNKDNQLLDINNAASLSNYTKTYNKLSLVLENLINGVSDKKGGKRSLNDKEFEQLLFKGKIYGKDEKDEPKYTGYGLKSIADILSKQKTNVTTADAIIEFRQKIEAVYKDSDVDTVSEYIRESEDKLVKVFREFHEKAFSEFNKNKNIANTQYKNYGFDKDGNKDKTQEALESLIGGGQMEDLEANFGEKASADAISLVSKAKYVQAVSEIAENKEKQRLEENPAIKEENRKYDDVSYVANAIGKSEYNMAFGNTSYYDTNTQSTKLQSPKTNFANNTDKGILIKNENGANVPDISVVQRYLELSKNTKLEIAELLKAIIQEQMETRERTSHINQGDVATLNVKDNSATSLREEGVVSNEENSESAKYKENETPEPVEVREVEEKTVSISVEAMQEETSSEDENIVVTEDAEIQEAIEEDRNDIKLNLDLFGIDEEDEVEIQKASSVVVDLQLDKEEKVKAVGATLLR